MFTMFRAALMMVLLTSATLPGQDVPTQDDLASKPLYERMLKGADLAKAEELEKKYQESMDARKFAEAKKIAEEMLALRTRLQGADHWEVTDARLLGFDSELYGKLKPEELFELAQAERLVTLQPSTVEIDFSVGKSPVVSQILNAFTIASVGFMPRSFSVRNTLIRIDWVSAPASLPFA